MLHWTHVGIRASAFKHGQNREDIQHAIKWRLTIDDIDDWLGQRQVRIVGPNLSGLFIVVMGTSQQDWLIVFHAQPLKPGRSRKSLRHDT